MHYIDLFDDYPFFYAAMVRNMNPKAQARMITDYNLWGDPTCYYDGGIYNSLGGYPSGQTDTCLSRIFATAARDVHDLELEVHWSWKGGGIIEIYFTVTNIELVNDAPVVPDAPTGISDGEVNLLDILFLIAYKYNNPPGEAPNPIEAGDANGDGDINLLDILYLIGYKYNTPPGPEPICPE